MQTPILIDTHTHLYLDSFKDDIDDVIERSFEKGVSKMLLPNIDSSSIDDMLRLCDRYEGRLFPMMGLHPTSVKENYKFELAMIHEQLKKRDFLAIGEIGIDLYWDKTYLKEQEEVFRTQLKWAKKLDLPVVIHARDSFDEIFNILDQEYEESLKGVFHSFTGNIQQAKKVLEYDFYIGINGIVTFKNSKLPEAVAIIPTEKLLLETDAPFLAPVPYRGKRNESSYLVNIADKIAEVHQLSQKKIAQITSENAHKLFKINSL